MLRTQYFVFLGLVRNYSVVEKVKILVVEGWSCLHVQLGMEGMHVNLPSSDKYDHSWARM